MHIVINNVVPLNRGDEALMYVLRQFLLRRFPDADIKILSKNSTLNNLNNSLSEVMYLSDLEETWLYGKRRIVKNPLLLVNVLLRRLNLPLYLRKLKFLHTRQEAQILKVLLSADYIISNPGSYITNLYDFHDRIKVLKFLIESDKKVALFLHSLGPFSKKPYLSDLKYVLSNCDYLSVREHLSLEYAKSLSNKTKIISLGTDLAFSALNTAPNLNQNNKNRTRTAAVNFRAWNNITNNLTTVKKGAAIVSHLVKMHGYKIFFLSTSQSIKEYKDDSLLSKEIIKLLELSVAEHVTIDTSVNNFKELISKYAQASLYVGMRMHGAIFSILTETVPLCLTLEHKVEGIFEPLDLLDMCIPTSSSVEDILARIDFLLENYDTCQKKIKAAKIKAHNMNLVEIDKIVDKIKGV